MTYWDNGHMNTGWGLVMLLGMVAFWVLVSVAAVWLFRTAARSRPSTGERTDGAEQILAERLARGEIDAEEYRDRLTAMQLSG